VFVGSFDFGAVRLVGSPRGSSVRSVSASCVWVLEGEVVFAASSFLRFSRRDSMVLNLVSQTTMHLVQTCSDSWENVVPEWLQVVQSPVCSLVLFCL